MTGTDVNAVLAFVVAAAATVSLAAWSSPQALNWAIDRMRARSEALKAARQRYREVYAAARRSRLNTAEGQD